MRNLECRILWRKRLPLVAVFLLGLAWLGLPIQHSAFRIPYSHKVHVSVAQLEYNHKAQSVEMVLRVYADDLENAVSQHAKRQIKIDPATANKDKRIGETILAYLRSSLELKTKTGSPVKLNWVGLDSQVDMYWIYVEGKMPAMPANSNGLDGSQLKNKVFCELFEDQVNIVNTKIREKQVGLMFEAKDGFKIISDRVISKLK
ncbi:MAG TPA: hypothetical protein PLK30_01930 [Blastocatellia bacterium]|nr:hypothetical protein [Blastocatellia bacterium]